MDEVVKMIATQFTTFAGDPLELPQGPPLWESMLAKCDQSQTAKNLAIGLIANALYLIPLYKMIKAYI